MPDFLELIDGPRPFDCGALETPTSPDGVPGKRVELCKMKALLILLFLFSVPTLACLQVSETDIDGNDVTIAIEPFDQLTARRHNLQFWTERREKLAAQVKAKPDDRKVRNDYGVALARTGEVEKALQLFREMEAQSPGHYDTAANLGTVLELSGKDKEALDWIREAIKRNPKSHRGTEWVHVRILEAKLARASDPNWLRAHFIVGSDFGSQGRPVPSGQLRDKAEMKRVAADLEYQLRERLSLVSPPDVYVGDLLFQLGNMAALTRSVERGIAILELGEEYGTSRPELLRTRLEYLRSVLPDKAHDNLAEARRAALASSTPVATSSPKTSNSTKDVTATKARNPAITQALVIAPLAIVLALLFWQRRRSRGQTPQ